LNCEDSKGDGSRHEGENEVSGFKLKSVAFDGKDIPAGKAIAERLPAFLPVLLPVLLF
jgi:hypothetical protein